MTKNTGRHDNTIAGDAALGALAAGKHAGSLVWQVDDLHDYEPFACLFAGGVSGKRDKIVYFHFADHELPVPGAETDVVTVNPQEGFEPFIDDILGSIQERGNNVKYLFDCISPLAADWYSDQMVGNFFAIVCGALRAVNGAACFAILRNRHSQYAVDPITETARAV
ncbi:MAG TPA: pyruvate, phosphate dikinase, partial [Candidatus Hydrogenedentes bacterium]|nr:pyruvate, phosphate dikinase [Candidatus Hydrogenedentota bacterium]